MAVLSSDRQLLLCSHTVQTPVTFINPYKHCVEYQLPAVFAPHVQLPHPMLRLPTSLPAWYLLPLAGLSRYGAAYLFVRNEKF
ncbi:hypothetical protein ICL16_33055 [Iningainema sp. BLCCT55]|uniref:Uncharacterized protein n=1 Tax=Iningainema tapete BLCC-T55 TaxID=2748662 RepID=A0A8J6XL48_9CYAN|nr:hypothetical protein [Iningainema tapete]MBD2776753.1 hypothetical protein [Iningainema tapete BLCC-T55]